jgi:hypothetical protein
VASIGKALEGKLNLASPREKARGRADDEKTPISSASAAPAMPPSPRPSAPPSDLPPPPPPSDLPPLPPSPFVAPSAPPATTPPRFGPPKVASDEIDRIASRFVQAYVDDGLDIKAIGRGNAAPRGGDKAFKAMSKFFNSQLDCTELPAIVERSRKRIGADYGDRPQDLQSKKSADAAEGQKVEVDLALIEPYARSILGFVAGARQLPSESGMTPGVMAMINAIDARMRDALLAHCKDQLKAAALTRDEEDAEKRLAKIGEYGWDKNTFDRLVKQGVYSAKDIEKARLNLILNLVCTRCVTPYILFAGQQANKDGSPAQTDVAATTRLLSAGVNRLFNKNCLPFCKALMQGSDKTLPPAADKELEALRVAHRGRNLLTKPTPSRRDKVGSGAAQRRSMPTELRDGKLGNELVRQKKAHAKELIRAEYEANRDIEIDEFKLAHGSEFKNRDFALVFSKLLRAWKSANEDVPIDEIAAAMQVLYAQARQEFEKNAGQAKATPGKPSSARPGHAREASSSVKKRRESTSSEDDGADGLDRLSKAQRITLDDFIKSPVYKAGFERYPQLRQMIEEEAARWAKEGIGGDYAPLLKKFYETELRRCVRVSQKVFGRGARITNDELKTAVHEWRKQAGNPESIMLLEDLRKIMPGSVQALHLPGLKETSLTRNAEALTEQFMQRPEIKREFRTNKLLKAAFLSDAAGWLLLGAHAPDQQALVLRGYNDRLLRQYHENLKADKSDARMIAQFMETVQRWQQDNQGIAMTTDLLHTLSIEAAIDQQ